MANARDICTDALKDIGVLGESEIATAGDALEALAALNRIIDQMAAERLTIHQLARTTWTIAASTASYTVGSGGTVNVARPVYPLNVAYYVTAGSPTTEIAIDPFIDDEWMALAQKGLTSTAPTRWWLNPTFGASGYATLYLWPIPTVSTLTGVLYSPQPVSELATLDTTISLPPGYRRLLVKALALEVAPSYDRQPSPLLIDQAADAWRVVKRANVRPSEMCFGDAGVLFGGAGQGYDIKADQ